MADVVIAGHICLDVIPQFLGPADVEPGRLYEVGCAHMATGGAVANVGRALHRLGVDVALVGQIGPDLFGTEIRRILVSEAANMADNLVVAPDGATSYSVVVSPPGRDRTFLHMPGENDKFTAASVPDDVLAGARLLHFGYPPLMARMFADEGAELFALLSRAKALGLATSLDMSLPDPSSDSGRAPWALILERVLPLVDFFLPGEEELHFMLPGPAASQICLAMGAGVVVVKQGSRGVSARCASRGRLASVPGLTREAVWANRAASHPCFQVDVVGTTGSGDATVAGFLMGILSGFGLEECLRAACAVGACSVEAVDAASGVRSWDETKARIDAGWKSHRPDESGERTGPLAR